jgi:hypothetical protein
MKLNARTQTETAPGNNADTDDDNDGQTDLHENNCGSDALDAASMSSDYDADGLPDCIDPDDDNDGQTDLDEAGLWLRSYG